MSFSVAFSTLMDAWNRHQELHTENATIAELVESLVRLDAARVQMSQNRNI
jgi:hypothetical protein